METSLELTLPSLALAISEAFPELEGRSIAVSEIEAFKDKSNVPTLPLAVVGLIRESVSKQIANASRLELEQDVLLMFTFEPVKYSMEGGDSSPFFAYYDYENIRDRVLFALHNWRSPKCAGITYKGLDVESDEFAVYISLKLMLKEVWELSDTNPTEALPFSIKGSVILPSTQ